MDRLEIDYHLESRDGESTVREVARQLEQLLSADEGLDEPVFVSKAIRGPLVEYTIVCHVPDADTEWSRIKPHVLERSVPGDLTVRKIEERSQSPVVIYPQNA